MEDNNGDVLEKVSYGVYRGRMVEDTTSKNVIGGFVYDKAGIKSPYSLETVLPIISYVDYDSAPGESTVGYNEGHYMITVTDPGENTSGGTGSGIWVITDSNNNYQNEIIEPGLQRRMKNLEPEEVKIYDRKGNCLEITISQTSKPYLNEIYKHKDETHVKLTVTDNEVSLWKIVQVVNDEENVLWTFPDNPMSETKEFNVSTDSKIIRIYNHAGNYLEVDLSRYETSNYRREYDYTQEGDGSDELIIYDAVGNAQVIPIDNEAPIIDSLIYKSGSYILQVHDDNSKLWKVVDDNGEEEFGDNVSSVTVTRQMEGVAYITVYDNANNSIEITLDKMQPIISSPIYDQGDYIVQVSDPDSEQRPGSGLWKIEDSNGTSVISSGGMNDKLVITSSTIRRPKINGPEMIYVYDKANNVTSMALTTSVPQIVSLEKKVSNSSIKLNVIDNEIDLWKVTLNPSSNSTSIAYLTGRNDTVNFTLPTNDVTKIYIYNHAGNYTQVNLADYETMLKPDVTNVEYKEGNFILAIKDNGSGISKVLYNNITYYTCGDTFMAPRVNDINSAVVYDDLGNTEVVSLTTDRPCLVSARKMGSNVKIKVFDEDINLWKITDGENLLCALGGRDDEVEFTTISNTLYIYNHAGNYIIVDLSKYIAGNFDIEGDYLFEKDYIDEDYDITLTEEEMANLTEEEKNKLINDRIANERFNRWLESMIEKYGGFRIYDAVGNYTEYPPQELILPELESVAWRNSTWDKFKISVSDEIGLDKITKTDGDVGIHDLSAATEGSLIKNITGTECTTNFSVVPNTIDSFNVYDRSHNKLLVNTFSLDEDAPVVEKLVGNKVRLTDNESGVWKIEDSNGAILVDYSPIFPATRDFIVPLGYDNIRVYDAVDNSILIYMRKEIGRDTPSSKRTFSESEPSGLKIISDCTITFDNTEDITIGNALSLHPGIEIEPGVTLTINLTGTGRVNIYGGRTIDTYGSDIRCAGIYVPTGSTLNIMGTNGSGVMNVYGNGSPNINDNNAYGTAAGIGGNGVCITNASTSVTCSNAGSINISANASVIAQGGYHSANVYGSGAGIGGGGVYNTTVASVSGRSVNSVTISSNASVSAKGGYSTSRDSVNGEVEGSGAGIGGGGICNTYATSINGGNTGSFSVSGGNVEAIGGYAIYRAKGLGAGVGGGGVANKAESATIFGGNMNSVNITGGLTRGYGGHGEISYGSGAGIGGGGVASSQTASIKPGNLGSNVVVASDDMIIAIKGNGVNTYGIGEDKGYGGVYNYGTAEASEEYRNTCNITRAYKWGTNAIITVDDVGQGLDKITETIGGNTVAELVQDSQTVVFTLSSNSIDCVYIYDKNGTYEKVDLIEDETKPLVRRRRSNNQLILEVQDNESGLWKIENATDNYVIKDYTEYNYPRNIQYYTVPSKYSQIRVYNALGNYETVELTGDYESPIVYNIIGVGDGRISITVSDDTGVASVEHYKNGELVGTIMLEGSSSDETIIDVPDDTENVIVKDTFGNEEAVIIGNIAQLKDVYKKRGDKIKFTIANVKSVYYGDNQVLLNEPNDGTYELNIPSGIDEIHIVDPDDQDVVINLNTITQITKAMRSMDEKRMLTDISSSTPIAGIDYLDINDDITGSREILSDVMSIVGVRDIPNGTKVFKLIYKNGRTCRVELDQDDSNPLASNIYITAEEKISVTLEDPAGVSRIEWFDSVGDEHYIDIEGWPTETLLELDMGIDKILVYDVFEDVSVAELSPCLTVHIGTVSGERAKLDLSSIKEISKIEYVDTSGIRQEITQGIVLIDGVYKYSGVINDLGEEKKVTVVYDVSEGRPNDVVTLKEDPRSKVSNAYIENDKVVITLSDASGLCELKYGEGVHDKVIIDPPETTKVVRIPAPISSITVEDTLGNIEVIALVDLMSVGNMYVRNGEISIDVNNVDRVYYVDAGTEYSVAVNSGKARMPLSVKEVHLVYGNHDIVVTIPRDVTQVRRVTTSTDGKSVVVDVSKEILNIVLKDAQDNILTIASTDEKITTVSSGNIAKVILTYVDGGNNVLEVETKGELVVSNMYITGTGEEINIDISSNAGIEEVTYVYMNVNNTQKLGGVVDARVEVPLLASNVVVWDGLGGENSISISDNIPMIGNLYRNADGDVCVTTNKNELYYDVGQSIATLPVFLENTVVPYGIDIVYSKNGDGVKDAQVDLSGVSIIVRRASVNEDVSLAALNISVGEGETIKQILFYDSQGEEIANSAYNVGTQDINQNISLPSNDVRKIGVVYGDVNTNNKVRVNLVSDTAISELSNLVGLEDGDMLVTIEDSAGIYNMLYEDEYGIETVLELGGSTRVTQKITSDMYDVKVVDGFGTVSDVDISEMSIVANIFCASVSGDGNKAVLNITGVTKDINRIWYIDQLGNKHSIAVEDSTFNDIIDVRGASKLVVVYQDESVTEVIPTQDVTEPTVRNVRREYMALKMTVSDKSGLFKIMDNSNRILKTYSSGDVFDNEATVGIAKGVTQVYVYDRLGNVKELVLSNYPFVDNLYKDKNGNISVETEGTQISYIDVRGNDVLVYEENVVDNRNPDGTITLPKEVNKLYFTPIGGGETIAIDVPEESISKMVKRVNDDTTKVRIDVGARDVIKLICYNDLAREIGIVTGNPIDLDQAISVENGTTRVRIVYQDKSSNVVTLEQYSGTSFDNAYESSLDGIKSIRVENNSGVRKLRYKLDESEVVYEVDLGDDIETRVNIPANAREIIIVDGFGVPINVTGLSDLPRLSNMYYDRQGRVLIKANTQIYYGDDVAVETSGDIYIVPEGISEIYTKKEGIRDVTVDISNLDIRVKSSAVKGNRIALHFESKRDIASIVCLGGVEDKTIPVNNLTQVNCVLEDTPMGTTAVKLVCAADQYGNIVKTTEILLEDDLSIPKVMNTILLEDGSIRATLEDVAGIKEIRYGEDKDDKVDIIDNLTEVEQEFRVPKGIDIVRIVDMFGEYKELDIREGALDTVIESCAKNIAEEMALIEFSTKPSKGGIVSVSYVDRQGVLHKDSVMGLPLSYNKELAIGGAKEIVIEYGDGTTSIIDIKIDNEGPIMSEFARDGQGKYKVKMSDKRGIKTVKLGEESITLTDMPKNVIAKIDTKLYKTSAYSIMSVEEGGISVNENGNDVIITIKPSNGLEKVTFEDRYGNETDINTKSIDREIEADLDSPLYSIEYENGKYILRLEDSSGLDNVIGKITGEVVHQIEGYPTSWTSDISENPVIYVGKERINETALLARDALGNEIEIPLQVDDGLGARVAWKYKKENVIYMKIVDSVGITEIIKENGDTFAIYDDNRKEVLLEYIVDNQSFLKVRDIFGHENVIFLNDEMLVVNGAYRNETGDRIVLNVVDKINGVSKVTYANGVLIDDNMREGVREFFNVVEGTEMIRVYDGKGEHYAEIVLDIDNSGATVPSNMEGGKLYIGNGNVLIKAIDNESGIGEIIAGETLSFSGEMNEEIGQLLANGVSTVLVRDGLGNVTNVDIGDLEEDNEKPQASIRYISEENRYEIAMSDNGAGLWKLVRNNEDVIYDYSNYLRDSDELYPREQIVPLKDIIGVTKLEVYDALGNKVEINLEDVLCIVTYVYKNVSDNKVAISVQDVRGISKIAVESDYRGRHRENTLEKFKVPREKVRKCYDVNGGVSVVKVYSGDFKVMRWDDIKIYEVEPTVNGNSVYSLVGIRTLEYDDGVAVEFKRDMPTKVKVDLINHAYVYVSDALDNKVRVGNVT
ncbi:MAG: hypothetical protein J6Y29_02495 [Clostridiales bacterium]|nr:hypothetical protein [Clostridiales bacterium]